MSTNPSEKVFQGHTACPGCGATIAMKLASEVFPEKSVMVLPASCWSVIAGPYPLKTLNYPATHVAFATGAAVATGISYALKSRGDNDARAIVWAGDGGTFDIGLQALSGALERGVPFTYICYDNEAYMNTGIQRSSATPLYGITTTTTETAPKPQNKKDFLEIVAAHNIPYAATASIAYPDDFQKKVKKAVAADGPSVIHLFSSCPTGQGYKERYSVKVARLAVESGVFPLYEVEDGVQYTINKKPSFDRLEEYLKMQSRFRHLTDENIADIQKNIKKRWKVLEMKEKISQTLQMDE